MKPHYAVLVGSRNGFARDVHKQMSSFATVKQNLFSLDAI